MIQRTYRRWVVHGFVGTDGFDRWGWEEVPVRIPKGRHELVNPLDEPLPETPPEDPHLRAARELWQQVRKELRNTQPSVEFDDGR
jgi:hypothetical protein